MLDVFWTLGKFTPYRWAMIQYQGVRIRSNQPMTVMKLKKKAAALDYLETKKLVHANVRASNILLFADLPQPHIKLADPGKYGSGLRFSLKIGLRTVRIGLNRVWFAVET